MAYTLTNFDSNTSSFVTQNPWTNKYLVENTPKIHNTSLFYTPVQKFEKACFNPLDFISCHPRGVYAF